MIVNPVSFTYEQLSGLKFKELQKLSVQYNVNKRWAKKQELIENLLALKSLSGSTDDKDKKINQNQNDEKEWTDGSVVFKDLEINNGDKNDKRLTFNITNNSCENVVDSRLTFEVPQKGKNLLDVKDATVDSRQTYEIPPNKMESDVEHLTESRATFDIAPKESLLTSKIDSRATFDVPQNGKKILEEFSTLKDVKGEDLNLKKNSNNSREKAKKEKEKVENEKIQTQIKMLTIPYARITRRTRMNGDTTKAVDSPIKMSKKSINIKKSTRPAISKLDLMKSPALSSFKKQANKQIIMQSLPKAQPVKTTQSKIPTRLQFNEEKPSGGNEGNKENLKRILRRKSKDSDQVLIKKTNSVSFLSPPIGLKKNSKLSQPLRKTPRKETEGHQTLLRKLNTNCQTPASKSSSTTKPITATKMPDFGKIHKKQFEQMDSLHDYLKKKEERTRKLFGTPQHASQPKAFNESVTKATPLFRFQSVAACKSESKLGKLNDNAKNGTTPNKKKIAQKEIFKSKLPPTTLQTDIKDKNRSHIHGVRTNKRFELQMRFRNM